MDKNVVLSRIKEKGFERNGRINLPCKAVFEIACELNIPLKDISDICNAGNIRLSNCQLGCFN